MGNRLYSVLIVVVMGLAAAAINLFRLPLFFEAEFIFGQFLVLLVAILPGTSGRFCCVP